MVAGNPFNKLTPKGIALVNKGLVSEVLSKAIKESMRFEELMDKTDFNSWFYPEQDTLFSDFKQDRSPYDEFTRNVLEMERICSELKKFGTPILDLKNATKHESWLIYQLFDSKNKRLKVKTVINENLLKTEKEEFEEAANKLQIALSELHKMTFDYEIVKDLWEILICNDLSICYSGTKNPSLSKGYADKAIGLIKEINSDDQEIKSILTNLKSIANYNQAIAENNSKLFEEAEKSFKKIITTPADSLKFNFQSAILELGRIFIDQGRSKEAAELLEELLELEPKRGYILVTSKNRLTELDTRYWKAHIEYISSLIDQAQYKSAKGLLKKLFFESEKSCDLNTRHKITFQGFSALNCLFRCYIEELKSTIEIEDDLNAETEKIAHEVIAQIENMAKRYQNEPIREAYNNLGKYFSLLVKEAKAEVYDKATKIKLNEKCFEYYLNSIHPTIELSEFFSNKFKRNELLRGCDDSAILFSLLCILCDNKNFSKKPNKVNASCRKDVLLDIYCGIEKLCGDKSEKNRLKQAKHKMNEALGEKDNNFPLDDTTILSEIDKYFLSGKGLTGKIIRHRLDINEKKFDNVLFGRSELRNCANIESILGEFIFLRRWNSFSPGLYRRDAIGSLGGGYLIRIKTKENGDNRFENIVVDPGYNFLQNFSNEKFFIADIDTIVITHSHLDHCADLHSIMGLIFQINKRYKNYPKQKKGTKKKRINLCLSQSAYKRFYPHIKDWEELLRDVVILENLSKPWSPVPEVEITAIKTPHDDMAGENGTGIKIKSKTSNFCFGITSDTPYFYDELGTFFAECDVLCLHCGGIKYPEMGFNEKIYEIDEQLRKISNSDLVKEIKKTYCNSNHLLFWGTKKLISDCCLNADVKEKIVIIGEFGEELKYSLRSDLCSKLSQENEDIKCLPADIGLYLKLEKNEDKLIKKIRCDFCETFVHKDDIVTFPFERGDSIQYICKSCDCTLSQLQKQSIIEHRESQDSRYN
jgi:tetratricopeptide (TPR) repeat protein